MDNKTEAPVSARLKALVILTGLAPYSGAVFVMFTQNVVWLSVAGVIVCTLAVVARHAVRKSRNSPTASSMLAVDVLLIPVYYVFAVVIVKYMFLRRR